MATKKKSTVTPDREELVLKAMNLIREGHTTNYIQEEIGALTEGECSLDVIREIVDEASFLLSDDYLSKVKDIKLLHIRRYQKEITRLLSTTEQPEVAEPSKKPVTYKQFIAARNKKIKAFDKAIDTMVQLENILQLSNDDLTVDINHQVGIMVNDLPKTYDISKLTFEEQVELMELMELAKVGKEELLSVTQAAGQENEETIDIVAEVFPANVQDIKHEVPEVIPVTEATFFDPTKKLRENIARLAAKKIQEAGGNHTDEEKKLLD